MNQVGQLERPAQNRIYKRETSDGKNLERAGKAVGKSIT